MFIARYRVEARPEAVVLMDGHLIFPEGYNYDWYRVVKENEPTIIAIFNTLHCENIGVSTDDWGLGLRKVLGIFFGNIQIDHHYYGQSIGYSRGGDFDGMGESIFTDWYYEALGYG